MGRSVWDIVKQQKLFYVHGYRYMLTGLMVSLVINIVLALMVFYFQNNKPVRDYYASSGVTPPVKLTAMATPNFGSTALLSPDPPFDDATLAKPLPQ